MRQLPLSVRLRDRALFDNFLAGPNEATLTQLRALALQPRPGLTWLSGPPASGKSHLLQALYAESPGATFLPLSQLTLFGPAALQEWHGATALYVDELATVLGHPEWERALFGLYRDCEERGASMVFAARETPAELPFALADLASRCAAAARLRLHALDESQQGQALQWRAKARGFELPEETTRFLQRRLPRAMHSLCAVLDELDEAALEAQRRLTVPFIRGLLDGHAVGTARLCQVSGNVQGVWYRATAQRRAAALGVTGHARNLADGSVEVLACGLQGAVREFIGWLWVGPPQARVASVIDSAATGLPGAWPREFTTA
jgi:DnaA-homolog protein